MLDAIIPMPAIVSRKNLDPPSSMCFHTGNVPKPMYSSISPRRRNAVQTITKRLGVPSLKGTRGFLFATLIDALGSGLFMPFSFLYFHVIAGFPLTMIGLVFSTSAIFALFIPLFAGSLVDRFGAKRIVIAAQVLQGSGFLCYLVVHELLVMGGSVLLVALGQRLFWSAYFTLLVDLTPSEE
ncbi:MAG TPA: hypothetical protein DHW02_08080, partial [Ktedonobacter sp.]|nr:hypothetical protein [Ktedonobacter sp.]